MTDRPAPPQPNSLAYVNGLIAYLVWGVVGLYFKLITVAHGVPAFTLLAHRVVWSLAFVTLVVLAIGRWREMRDAFANRRLLLGLTATSLLIAVNWIVFIYASATGRLVPASLGYFLAPIASVLLGVALLGERLRRGQLVAVVIAVVGVAVLFVLKASALWIPIGLTLSWSFYALLRKRIAVNPIVGLGVETAVLLPLAILYLALVPSTGPVAPSTYTLLIAAGVITAVPLMLFAYAARRLPMVTLGLMQYVGPTVQFLVARFIAGEQVRTPELLGFALIWLGLIVFTVDGLRTARTAPPVPPAD